MVLRFVLVSLVASLGVDLPGPADLGRWIDSGRVWLSAPEESGKIVGDEVIEVVEEEGAAAAPGPSMKLAESVRREGDSASIEVVDLEAVVEERETAEGEEVAVEDAVFESVVDAMAESFSETEPDGFVPKAVELTQIQPEIAVEAVEAAALAVAREREDGDPPVEAAAVAVGPSRAERLGVAVQLTGQAIHAWMKVLRPGASLVSAR